PLRGYEEVEKLAVHGDAIDFGYIARLETDARSGDKGAIGRVAAAHYAAAEFLVAKGDTDDAIDHYRQALVFAPENTGILLNLAVLELRESHFTAALDPLEHARHFTPDDSPLAADIAKLEGWAYYGANKLDLAIEQWKRAEKLRPDPDVEQALEKAQRDKDEEESYREGETAHFQLKYYGGAAPELAREILRALEDDFNDLESQLDYTPPDQISVILYTEQAFGDITRAPGWAGAINDGRIRIPVQGLTGVTPDLARVLKHELTHSFVGQKSRGRAPTWLQEGIAQFMEGRRSAADAGALVDAAAAGAIPSLSAMEGSWMGQPENSVALDYAWSLAVVESIVQSGGMTDIGRLLDRVAAAPSTEDACRDVLRSSYSDLQDQTVIYLRREYVR
ncbi:MAG TPA: tetratricopeptide repeat protein, partial [Candidatus Acidoferrales bacterium]|nr:tetratricopeptide repeat protein [Candidatus Acidoferrales bacterium]